MIPCYDRLYCEHMQVCPRRVVRRLKPAKMAVRLVVAFLFLIAAIMVVGGDTAEDGVCTKDEPGCETVETDSSAGQSVGYREHLGVTVKAHFAMACFWGVEATFGCQPGVVRVRAGYMGGEKEEPTYKDLGDHTETVEVEYDPYKTKFSSLLEVFWKYHDYTAAYKTQYMSAIFYHDEEQKELAGKGKKEREQNGEKVETKILPAKIFYKAEDYHQKYFLRQHKKLVSELLLSDTDMMDSSRTSRLLGYLAGPGEVEDFHKEAPSLGLTEDQADYVREQMKSKIYEGCAP